MTAAVSAHRLQSDARHSIAGGGRLRLPPVSARRLRPAVHRSQATADCDCRRDGRPAPATALPGDCCGLPSPTRSRDGSKRPKPDHLRVLFWLKTSRYQQVPGSTRGRRLRSAAPGRRHQHKRVKPIVAERRSGDGPWQLTRPSWRSRRWRAGSSRASLTPPGEAG